MNSTNVSKNLVFFFVSFLFKVSSRLDQQSPTRPLPNVQKKMLVNRERVRDRKRKNTNTLCIRCWYKIYDLCSVKQDSHFLVVLWRSLWKRRATFDGVGLPQRGNKSQKHRASGKVELRCASLYIYILFKKTLEEIKGSRINIFRWCCIVGLIGERRLVKSWWLL